MLRSLKPSEERVVVPDLALMEVGFGARDERHAAQLEAVLRSFDVVEVGGVENASAAALNYRRLRSAGVTIRSSVDLLIGTYCLRHDAVLLHQDRDYAAMERHLGLRCL